MMLIRKGENSPSTQSSPPERADPRGDTFWRGGNGTQKQSDWVASIQDGFLEEALC